MTDQVTSVLSIAFEVPVGADFAAQAKAMEAMQAEVDALRAKVAAQNGTAKIGIVRKRPAKPEAPAAPVVHAAAHGTAGTASKAA